MGVALGDVDDDNDLDAFVAVEDGPNIVWLNDGNGNFIDSGQRIGIKSSTHVALGDLDGDNDLDAFVTNRNPLGGGDGNKVWLNDGSGNFTDSFQYLGYAESWEVSLADVDGDTDLDAFVVNGQSKPNKVYFNDGNGNFTDSGQSLGSSISYGIALGDLDSDGDKDAFVANNVDAPNKVWLNVSPCECDLNADGKCDMQDWLKFGEDWGRTDCP
jgi:hypothetical protein